MYVHVDIIQLLFLLIFCLFCDGVLQYNKNELSDIFIENLKVDPILLADSQFSTQSKQFVDQQLRNYRELMNDWSERNVNRVKRNTVDRKRNLIELTFHEEISKDILDLSWFEQNSNWYAAFLENRNKLVVYKYVNNTLLLPVSNKTVSNVNKISSYSFGNFAVLSVISADNSNITIYLFEQDNNLERIQTIHSKHILDVSIWKQHNDVYFAPVQYKSESGIFEMQSAIYKWTGKYFDINHYIETSAVKRIDHFFVGPIHFLAVANYKSDDDSKTFSEILQYNLNTDKYEPYQRILTKFCIDIDYFKIFNSKQNEHFLIHLNENSNSVIYKLVNNYFIPFQNIDETIVNNWFPITHNKTTLLLGHSETRIIMYYYNGWNFERGSVLVDDPVSENIRSIDLVTVKDIVMLIINTEKYVTTYKIHINISNEYSTEYKELLQWCQISLESLNEVEELVNSRADIEEVEIDGQIKEFHLEHEDFEEINKMLASYDSLLKEVSQEIENSQQNTTKKFINGDISVDTIIINDDAFFNSITSDSLNNYNVPNLLANKINISTDFNITGPMNFQSANFSNITSVEKLNNLPFENLLRKNHNLKFDNLVVDGRVHLKEPVNPKTMNNITWNTENILLISTPQNLSHFHIDKMKTNYLHSKILNGKELHEPELLLNRKIVENLSELNVDNLYIGGFINNVDVPTLKKYSLEKSGNQIIEKPYFFESLEADNLDVKGLFAGKQIPEELVLVNEGRYEINQDIRFTKPIFVNNLTATRFLNSVQVKKGKLDIVLKESEDTQYISGEKTIENVELVNLISLHGKIDNPDFQTRNPVVHIEDELTIEEDVHIVGDVEIENQIVADNYLSVDQNYNVERVQKFGLSLKATEIKNSLKFQQQLNVDEIFVEQINDVKVNNWIVNGDNQTQIITGAKKIIGDLEITGDTNVFMVNNINVAELEANLLTRTGDQRIFGKHFVNSVAAETGLTTNQTKFGPNSWSEVLTSNDEQVISGTTTLHSDLLANNLKVNGLTLTGLLNGLNFSEIIQDSVSVDSKRNITGLKTFENLSVTSLLVNEGDLEKFGTINDTFEINGDFAIPKLSVNHLNVTKSCNGMDKQLLDSLYSRDYVNNVYENTSLKTVTIFGNAFIRSHLINGVPMKELVEETVKIDEPFHFFSGIFEDSVFAKEVHTLGHIDRFDLENIVGAVEDQIIVQDPINFEKNLLINGTLTFNGIVNQKDIIPFCKMINEQHLSDNYIIEGNVVFAKNPKIKSINNHSAFDLTTLAWLNNQPTNLTGHINFSAALFEEDVKVNGYINDIHIKYLYENYFSKSKNQTIHSNLNFDGNVMFNEDVSGSKLVAPLINGIDMEEFLKTAILNDFEQLFEIRPFIESVEAKKLEGDKYLINDLNLENDVMRYDKTNIITGPKLVKDLNVHNLKVSHNVLLQNVNISDWLKHVVLKSGNYSISGTKVFNNISIERNLGIKENLNMVKFSNETVLQRNLEQIITGKKTFIPNNSTGVVFKTIKLRNQFNKMSFEEFIHNQAYKNIDNSFKSKMTFNNEISTKNLIIGDLYKNINISTVISNLTRLSVLNNFKDNFKDAFATIEEIKHSLEDQPFKIQKYKTIMFLNKIDKIMNFKCSDQIDRLLTFTYENGMCLADVYEWNRNNSQFIRTVSKLDFGPFPNFYDTITFNGKTLLFIEHRIEIPDQVIKYEAQLIEIQDASHYDIITSFPTNGTSFASFLTIPKTNLNCLVLAEQQLSNNLNIMCLENGTFVNYQTLISSGVKMISVVNIGNSPHLVTLNNPNNQQQFVTIWKLNNATLQFEEHQFLYEEKPKCVTTVAFNDDEYFLASVFGQPSTVAVNRFNPVSNKFEMFQTLDAEHYPIYIKLRKLPSNELLLYVLAKEMFTIYKYEGVAGFVKIIQSNSIIDGEGPMNWFSIDNEHFIIIKHNDEISVIQGIFNRPLK